MEIIRNTPCSFNFHVLFRISANFALIGSGPVFCAAFEGSFAAEIIRGGIQAVERGQYEAGDATGLSKFDKYRYVIIPQALPLILPPLPVCLYP